MILPYSRVRRAQSSAELDQLVQAVCTHYGLDGSLQIGDLIESAYDDGKSDLAEFFEAVEKRLSELDA